MRVAVLGVGSWGTALATLLARNGLEVTLAGRESLALEQVQSVRENLHYLPGFVLPKDIRAVALEKVEPDHDVWIVATPSGGVREVLQFVAGDAPRVLVASKGLEPMTGALLSDVVRQVHPSAKISAISGPNLAIEIMRSIPTAAVVASEDEEDAAKLAHMFNCVHFRAYVSNDLRGVELAGALKNVLAIAAGMSDGLGFGDNTKGALVARGLLEMSRFGKHYGARSETFLGIAGVGDLFATANSKLSRNYRVGYGIGRGETLRSVLDEIGQVAEGVGTAEVAAVISRQHMLPTPIFEMTDAVLRSRISPMDGVSRLMQNMPKREGWEEI
ncbi:MAG: NAD(P)-dependent glycerol-3-phosphate dehydrogenase [Armatimonadetes bacterium]|nr:NAD(P)-dependent glycerol-3-phosphate dehydrogenase [Armatimonadota bacterium]